VDHLGNVVDGDEILYVIARERRRQNIDFGGVVGTAMSNLGLELALDALDVSFTRTAVGDRYVMKEMLARKWDLGGESSGHIICLDITTTGDGIVSALQALAAIVNSGQPLADLKSKMRKFPQSMINVKLANAVDLSANANVQTAISDVESQLGSNGRVLLRPSGTEPVVRVMVEGEDLEVVDKLARELSAVVASELGGP
jgi:phosphoglucosamine mutase